MYGGLKQKLITLGIISGKPGINLLSGGTDIFRVCRMGFEYGKLRLLYGSAITLRLFKLFPFLHFGLFQAASAVSGGNHNVL